jgi:hypothetical protein
MSKLVTGDPPQKVWKNGIGYNSLRGRFHDVVVEVVKYQKAAQTRSGTDNEVPDNDFVKSVEDVIERYREFETGIKNAKAKESEKEKKKQEEGYIVRDAAIGKITHKRKKQKVVTTPAATTPALAPNSTETDMDASERSNSFGSI